VLRRTAFGLLSMSANANSRLSFRTRACASRNPGRQVPARVAPGFQLFALKRFGWNDISGGFAFGLLRVLRHPLRRHIEDLVHHLRILPAALRRHMEGMIGVIDEVEFGAFAEADDGRLEQLGFGEFVG